MSNHDELPKDFGSDESNPLNHDDSFEANVDGDKPADKSGKIESEAGKTDSEPTSNPNSKPAARGDISGVFEELMATLGLNVGGDKAQNKFPKNSESADKAEDDQEKLGKSEKSSGFGKGFGTGFGGLGGLNGAGSNAAGRGRGGKTPGGAVLQGLKKPHFSPAVLTLGIVILAALVVFLMSQIWTEILWYREIGYLQVLLKQWGWFFGTGFAIGLIALILTWINLSLVLRFRPTGQKYKLKNVKLSLMQDLAVSRPKWLRFIVSLVVGLYFGYSYCGKWEEFLLAFYGGKFGEKEAQFGLDAGFYIFTLPALQTILEILAYLLVINLALTVFLYFVAGTFEALFKLVSERRKFNFRATFSLRSPRIHVFIMLALGALCYSANIWLSCYSMLLGHNSKFSGAGYTDINANLPARYILAGIGLIVAITCVWAAVRGRIFLPAVAIGAAVVSLVVVGVAYPLIVQRFQVEPNAITMEAPYIKRNIEATLKAYGLENVEKQTYTAKTKVEPGQLREDSESAASLRILDPNIVSPALNQLQQNRQYYGFAKDLSVDRYRLKDGKTHDTVIAVRELNLNGLGRDQRTWVNDHTVYTHGFGVVAAYGNTAQADGRPAFYEEGIPSTGNLGKYEPRVYFGQQSPEYSIVGAKAGAAPMELDYPDDKSANGQVNNTYSGKGGPSVGNLWNRLLYAIKFRSTEILFTDRVNENSQILYDRDPQVRVSKVAPYLTLDSKVYPAVVNMSGKEGDTKRLVWIIDAYTTSNAYPYSAQTDLRDAVEDSLAGNHQLVGGKERINYIRNSVKAVVDAYTGDVTLYEWGGHNPILEAWKHIYPGSVQPTSAIPTDLMHHLRYPKDLFKVQRTLLSRYHVTDAPSFYSGGDFWKLPDDPTKRDVSVGQTANRNGSFEPQPPYYLTMQMPGENKASFALTSTYIPGGNTDRNVLTGFLSVNSEAASLDGKVNPEFGKLRLLELPRDLTVPGPGQVQNNFDSNPSVSTQLNLLRNGGSSILFGNQLTLPMGGGLLYVEPVYIQSRGGTSYPLLRYVLTSFGESIGFAPTLNESLDQLFGGNSGAKAGDATVQKTDAPVSGSSGASAANGATGANSGGTDGNTGSTGGSLTTNPSSGSTSDGGTLSGGTANSGSTGSLNLPVGDLKAALEAARQAMADSKAALTRGDWAAYGQAQQRLAQALEAAVAADQAQRAKP